MLYMDFQVEICTKKKYIYFFFYKSETVKNFHFFFETKKLSLFFETDTRFIDLFYEKKEVSEETAFIFYFYCGSVSRENWMKLAVLLSDFRRGRQFHFLPDAAAVSFILFPTDSGGFIILAP